MPSCIEHALILCNGYYVASCGVGFNLDARLARKLNATGIIQAA